MTAAAPIGVSQQAISPTLGPPNTGFNTDPTTAGPMVAGMSVPGVSSYAPATVAPAAAPATGAPTGMVSASPTADTATATDTPTTAPPVTIGAQPLPHMQTALNFGFNLATAAPTFGLAPIANTVSGLLGGPTFGSLMNHPGTNTAAAGPASNGNVDRYQNPLGLPYGSSSVGASSSAPSPTPPAAPTSNTYYPPGYKPNSGNGLNINPVTTRYPVPLSAGHLYNPMNDPAVQQALAYGQAA